MSGGLPRLLTTETLTPDQVSAVLTLVRQAGDADGTPPIREEALLQIRAGIGLTVLAEAGAPGHGSLLGLAHLDASDGAAGPQLEVAVHPGARRRGVGSALLDELLGHCAAPPSPVRLWAHGQRSAAAELARARGFAPGRQLHQMRRSLATPLPEVRLPTGMALRSFDPDRDVPALQALNAATFTQLPDQGGWTQEDIRERMGQHGFDPSGLLLATSGRALVGFHWTKVPRDVAAGETRQSADAFGEVYVLGVHPAARGLGLGRALTLAGLHLLRDQGLSGALLYVDAENGPAIALYTSLGFRVWDSDMLFLR